MLRGDIKIHNCMQASNHSLEPYLWAVSGIFVASHKKTKKNCEEVFVNKKTKKNPAQSVSGVRLLQKSQTTEVIFLVRVG